MMKNIKSSTSKLDKGRRDKKHQQKSTSRSPLKVKDLNVPSFSSSSSTTTTTATSISCEAPIGCLSFFLSHYRSSSTAKNARDKPNIRNLRGISSDGNVVMKTCNNLQNPEKPISERAHKLRKNPPLSSRTCLDIKSSSGSELNLCDNAANFTPVTKLESGYGLDSFIRNDKSFKLANKDTNCSDTSSPVPVQVSVSPEIQGGLKCKPRGILTVGDDVLFGFSKTKMLKLDQEDDGGSGLRLNLDELPMPSRSISRLSSSSSSLGFSSEMFNKSNSTITSSDATTTSHSSRKGRSSFLHLASTSEFRGLIGPSFDHLVCSPTPSSPASVPSCKLDISPEEGKYRYDHVGEYTRSGNVLWTPKSNSNPSSLNLGLSHLSRDEISRLWFECELDSVTEVLRRVSLSPMVDSPRTSFEFNPLIKPASSIDFTILRKAIDSQIPAEFPESEVRISWREGLASCVFEMDELDCCRCFSDEEDEGSLPSTEDSSWTVCYKNHLFQK